MKQVLREPENGAEGTTAGTSPQQQQPKHNFWMVADPSSAKNPSEKLKLAKDPLLSLYHTPGALEALCGTGDAAIADDSPMKVNK